MKVFKNVKKDLIKLIYYFISYYLIIVYVITFIIISLLTFSLCLKLIKRKTGFIKLFHILITSLLI
jgi:hypothetical protein